MYCVKCGAKSSDEFNYCSNCGAQLVKEIDVSDFNTPVEENWNDIVYSQDKSVPFKNEVQEQNVYANYSRGFDNPQMLTEDDFKFNRMSIAGFVLACCSFLTDEAGIICAILGFIFSLIGLTSKNKIRKRGKGFAIAGITLSAAYLLFAVFVVFIIGIAFFSGFWYRYY